MRSVRRVSVHPGAAVGFDAAASASPSGAFDPATDLSAALERVTIGRTTLEIQVADGVAGDSSNRILVIPWTPPSPYRRRQIIQGEGEQSAAARPMRSEARALVTDALRDAHCWLDELATDSSRTVESIAAREKKTERSIRMTLSIAFLSPALVKAAIYGRLPRGFGVMQYASEKLPGPSSQDLCYRSVFDRARMTILTVKHLTTYSYAAPVRLGEHRMMLRPRDSNDQRLLKASLEIEPRPHRLRWIHDVFDNCVAIADFAGETRRLEVENNITLEHIAFDEPEFLLEDRARYYPFSYDAEEMPDLARAIERHYPDHSGELDHWVRQFVNQGRPTETGALLMTLTNAMKEGLSYERRTARGTQTPLQTLAARRGSCRDFATLMMEAARTLGFAARFVSGYLYVPGRDSGESHLGGGSTHAWCQIYLPGSGWVEFDPTNGIVGNRDLIRVAVARDARQAIPLHGSYFGNVEDEEGMVVSVNVRRLPEQEPSAHVLDDAET